MQKKINAQKLKIAAGLIFNGHPPKISVTTRRTHWTRSEQRNLADFLRSVHGSDAHQATDAERASSGFWIFA